MKYLSILLIICLVACKSEKQKRIDVLQAQYTSNLIKMEIYYQKSKRAHKKALISSSDSTISKEYTNESLMYLHKGDSLKEVNTGISIELLSLKSL